MTNGLSHPYHLDESTFILGTAGVTFHFYFIIRWISSKQTFFLYKGSGTYTKLVKLGQTGALPGQTVIAPPFSGYKRGFTDWTRVNPCHHRCEAWRYHSLSTDCAVRTAITAYQCGTCTTLRVSSVGLNFLSTHPVRRNFVRWYTYHFGFEW